MKRKLIAGAALFLLMGCTDARLQLDQQSLKDLKGQSAESVKEYLGAPQRSYTENGKTYLIYTTTYENYTPPTAPAYLSPGQNVNPGMPGSLGSYAPASCITTFTVESNVVTHVQSRGNCL